MAYSLIENLGARRIKGKFDSRQQFESKPQASIYLAPDAALLSFQDLGNPSKKAVNSVKCDLNDLYSLIYESIPDMIFAKMMQPKRQIRTT